VARARRTISRSTDGALVLTGELLRLNIEAQQLLDRLGLNFFQSI